MDEKSLKQIRDLCEADRSIGLFYFFGSRARGDGGENSDYDFAIYFDQEQAVNFSDKKLELLGKLSKILKTDSIDLVVLNQLVSSELKYMIIREGKLLFEREPLRLIAEVKIMNEYFDFRAIMIRHGLTKKAYDE